MRIQPVVIGVIKKNDKFLLTKRVKFDPEDQKFKPYVWNVPGGGIEFGETPEMAIIRELKEELGVDVEVDRFIPKLFTIVRDRWQGILIIFVCKMKNPDDKIIINDEADEYGWLTLEEILKLKTLPKVREILEEVNKIC